MPQELNDEQAISLLVLTNLRPKSKHPLSLTPQEREVAKEVWLEMHKRIAWMEQEQGQEQATTLRVPESVFPLADPSNAFHSAIGLPHLELCNTVAVVVDAEEARRGLGSRDPAIVESMQLGGSIVAMARAEYEKRKAEGRQPYKDGLAQTAVRWALYEMRQLHRTNPNRPLVELMRDARRRAAVWTAGEMMQAYVAKHPSGSPANAFC